MRRALAVLLVLLAAPLAAAQPRVVASVAPVHALAAGVMEGAAAPALLLPAAASPHAYALRPSQAQALASAELVFWIGPMYEEFLRKALGSLAPRARIVELARAPGVALLPAREGGAWAGGHRHAHGKAGDVPPDGHLFLDPRNAQAMVRAMAQALAAADAPNERRYAANAQRVLARLDRLDAELREQLAPVRDAPFVVFHDAYQYFERRYGLNAVGAITVSPERPPSAQRLRALRQRIAGLKAVCVFSEPQFKPALVGTVVEGTSASTGVLDPLGAGLAPGPEAYFQLLRALSGSLTGCLAPARP